MWKQTKTRLVKLFDAEKKRKILFFNWTKPHPSLIFSMQQLGPDISNGTADQTRAIVYTVDIYLQLPN